MAKGVNTSFRFDAQVKEEFASELYKRGLDMTETLEAFMINYVKIARSEGEKT